MIASVIFFTLVCAVLGSNILVIWTIKDILTEYETRLSTLEKLAKNFRGNSENE